MRHLAFAALLALPGMASAQIVGGVGKTVERTPDAAVNATLPVAGGAAHAAKDAAGGKAVTVQTGARVRVSRSTRCYDGRHYYGPDYAPDGQYYCETRGPGLAADAGVQPH
jgi:hypothetical protein